MKRSKTKVIRGFDGVRHRFEPHEVEAALNYLLSGKNVAVQCKTKTGEISLEEYYDPQMLIEGVKLFGESVGLWKE